MNKSWHEAMTSFVQHSSLVIEISRLDLWHNQFHCSHSSKLIVASSIFNPILRLPKPGHQFSKPVPACSLPSSLSPFTNRKPRSITSPLFAVSCRKSHQPKLVRLLYSNGKTLHYLSVPNNSPKLPFPSERGGCTICRSMPKYLVMVVELGKEGMYEMGL